MVVRATIAAALLAATSASGGPLEGVGDVTVAGGWRLTPNDAFAHSASVLGMPQVSRSLGGPTVTGSFGYAALDWLKVSIDLFAGGEQLRLTGIPAFNSITYGAAAGARFLGRVEQVGPLDDLIVFAGGLTGPTLVNVTGGNLSGSNETVAASYILSAGLTARIGEHWGVTLEYRLFVSARGAISTVGGVNGGGSWLSLGVTYLTTAQPDRRPN